MQRTSDRRNTTTSNCTRLTFIIRHRAVITETKYSDVSSGPLVRIRIISKTNIYRDGEFLAVDFWS